MKQFLVPCNFNGESAQVTFYIGNPETNHNPVSFQAAWLAQERGGVVPQEVMDSLQKLMNIANKNNILVADLCEYALYSTGAVKKDGVSDDSESQKSDPTEIEYQPSDDSEIKR